MTNTDELIGLWDTALYDYGVMESNLLALHSDGTGWSVLMNAAGAESTRLTWQCPAPGTLLLTEHEYTPGDWSDDVFHPSEPPSPYDARDECRFTVVLEKPPLAEAPVLTLKLDGAVGFASRYALVRRAPVPDRPAMLG